MSFSPRALPPSLLLALAVGWASSLAACAARPTSPVAGLQRPVDPPTMPDLGRGADRVRTETLYSMYVADDVRDVCAGPPPYFAFDSAKAKQSQPTMDTLATCMKKGPLKGRSIRLVGHTDPRGTEAYNEQLGLERAGNVKSYLVKQGIDASRIEVDSSGEDDASRARKEWPADRRVEIQLAR